MKKPQNDNIKQQYIWYKVITAGFKDLSTNTDYCWQLAKAAYEAWGVLTEIDSALIEKQSNNPSCFKFQAKNFNEECKTASFWAQQQLLANRKVGILILSPEKTRLQLDYIFSNFLAKSEYELWIPAKLNYSCFINIALLILKTANNILIY